MRVPTCAPLIVHPLPVAVLKVSTPQNDSKLTQTLIHYSFELVSPFLEYDVSLIAKRLIKRFRFQMSVYTRVY